MIMTDIISAARVPHRIQPQKFGLWEIRRVAPELILDRYRVGFPDYTLLHRWSCESLHREFGDVVMEDSMTELQKHIPISRAAHGDVLITGLGLGCVVRGLLAKPEVSSITVIELDADILRIIGQEFENNPRVSIHHADAFQFEPAKKYQFAWHDIEKMNEDQPHLATLHLQLLDRYSEWCEQQGAWGMPRWVNRFLPQQWALHTGRYTQHHKETA